MTKNLNASPKRCFAQIGFCTTKIAVQKPGGRPFLRPAEIKIFTAPQPQGNTFHSCRRPGGHGGTSPYSPVQPAMKCLLDVNILVAAILDSHTQHRIADKWLDGKALVTCPLSETGFLRVVTHPKIYGVPMPVAREALSDFISRHEPVFVPDDLKALKSSAQTSEQVTDFYLADLASTHHMKLATFDTRISHHAVEVISQLIFSSRTSCLCG